MINFSSKSGNRGVTNDEKLVCKGETMSGNTLPKNNRPLVCVVAEDLSIREGLSSFFRSAGLNVEIFPSAEEFLTTAQFKAVRCLIVDVQLAEISVVDLQQQLATREIEIPTIFLTGYEDIRIAVGEAKFGAVEVLTKPLDGDYLLETVWSAIRSYTSSQQVREENAQESLGRFRQMEGAANVLPHRP
jgi:FixJ family two-component response regulator